MQLRQVPYNMIVNQKIALVQAGVPINTEDLEAHFLAGGRVLDQLDQFGRLFRIQRQRGNAQRGAVPGHERGLGGGLGAQAVIDRRRKNRAPLRSDGRRMQKGHAVAPARDGDKGGLARRQGRQRHRHRPFGAQGQLSARLSACASSVTGEAGKRRSISRKVVQASAICPNRPRLRPSPSRASGATMPAGSAEKASR